jgi:uncharacterized protein with HEPN domain
MRAEDLIRLRHMVEASQTAMQFVQGRSRTDLQTDQLLLFAVVRAIEVLGEAANKVSEEVRLANTDIPWKAIVGMRNRLIHAYFDVDADMVWETVHVELPALLPHLQALLDFPT